MRRSALVLFPVVTVLFLLGPVIAGLAGVILPSFGYLPVLGGHGFGLDPWRTLLAMPGLWTSAALSLTSGLVTTAVAFSAVVLFVAAWSGTRSFEAFRRVLSPLLSIPHAAAAFGLAVLIAPSGWIVRLLSPWLTGYVRPPDVLILHDPWGLAMMLGLVCKEIPFLFLMTLAALPQTDADRMAQVTAGLGYGKLAGWLKVTLPRLYPLLRLPVLAVIAYASSVVDVALILGPTRPPTLAVNLTRWMNDPDLSMRFVASAGAVLQLGITASAIAIWLIAERLVIATSRARLSDGRRGGRDLFLRILSFIPASAAALLTLSAILALVPWSVSGYWRFPDALPGSISLRTWTDALPTLGTLGGTTMLIAFLATALAAVLTLGCLENETRGQGVAVRRAVSLIYIPLIVPQVAFLFGLQFLFLLIGAGSSLGAVILAHLVFVLPYVFLSLGDSWRSADPRYAHAAAGLGATPARVFWRIRLPMMLRPLLTACAVGLAVSIGQYLPTLLIGGGRWPTITTEAVALSSGGNRNLIAVYALVQTALPLAGFAAALAIPAWVFRNRTGMRSST